MRVLKTAACIYLPFLLAACSPASTQPLPRLDRYDFRDQTPNDLVRLRQIAPAEGPEGALARYALARAHADWLVLGLVHTHSGDMLLRRLAVDLGIEGASLDDQLTLEQVLECVARVSEEVHLGAEAGAEARTWARDMERLFEAVRVGWERFDPELFRAVAEVSSGEGPARLAADLLALGWATVALNAVGDRPNPEQASFLVRMAAYCDVDEVEAIEEGREHLFEGSLEPTCREVERQLDDLSPYERLGLVRSSCANADLDAPPNSGQLLSPELIAGTRILRDLIERRQRIEGSPQDPLKDAGAELISQFDRALESFRLPLPPPAPGPRVPTPPAVDGPGLWRTTGAVVIVGAEGDVHVAMWPTLAVHEGAVRLIDVGADLSVPGRNVGSNYRTNLDAVFQASREHLGQDERSVALLVDGEVSSQRLMEVVTACEEAEVGSIDLVARHGNGEYLSIPLTMERGAARNRTSSERRAVLVLGDEGLQLGNADGQWAEFQREGSTLPTSRLETALAEHVGGRGNAGVIVAVRPTSDVSAVARVLDFLSRLRRAAAADAGRGWQAWLDPEEPPAPTPVAETAAGAVSSHRVRMRSCYERFLRGGGTAQGMLVLELSVNGDGEVTSARVATSELGPQPSLDNCLVGEAQRIQFPPNTDAQVIRVPLRFVPEGVVGRLQ